MVVSPRIRSLFLLLCYAGAVHGAPNSFIHQAQNPFDNNGDSLPDLGMATPTGEGEKHLAEMAKAFGEASMTDNGLTTEEQARQFALGQVREAVSQEVNQHIESWLSPWGNASVDLLVNDEGRFTGSKGSWFIPWQDNNHYLTWSQLGLTQQEDGLVSNAGIGQRWVAGKWLLGYNTFYDNLLDENLQRAGLGAEAWGEYLRLSANYYQPFASWRDSSEVQEQRMARGYDVTAKAWLPFWHHLNTSVSFEQYFGDSVDLFQTGTGYHNPLAVNLGLDYTPVPLVTFSAGHKQGESGVSQNNLGLKLNYRFGVPLKKQLSAGEVAESRSLRGSRYDPPERQNLPVLEFRQRKTLSVWLATPPWDLKPGETVMLKLDIRSRHGVRSLHWQGDVQALSLTSPAKASDTEGWSIILPAWDSSEGASNRWRLSVVVEDEAGQRVSSNEITLALTQPLLALPEDDPRWTLLPDE
ncbi:YchO/YchP family invasin [Leclercia adecarboxylata]|uniref:YchO/YchP family invasin n=1 Tax=Leclercia barmai TaxID=2785629 RepID=A0ABS7RU63_9ENTR|nr:MULTISPECIES: YchO/YchP family invasin [Enterobacteriaceae]MBZ0056944.1 YchO/YchP family invasin [Leclercia sp. EMC7]MCM5694895.1 YchO/YchP family invasin [Leclercia sp. LTM01]MCM5698717.1 YchO/YchP family invasin [Leclercia sp. LTM14]QCZ29785.1 YchO/YchP family invasin [Leclercia adecarboxylata]TLU70419.1 YchO/YchP family invasin [Enterobacter sp. MF024]